jgi:hypothetical protein
MWPGSSRRAALGLATLAIALAAAGCGSHKQSVSDVAKQDDCASQVGHARADQVVRGLIAQGAISNAQVERAFRGVPRGAYLDASGRLLPFTHLSAAAQAAFVDWVGALESKEGGKKIFDAEMKATKNAQASCANA